MTDSLLSIIKKEFERRMIEESFMRVEKCARILNDQEFWRKPNDNSNSIGNLVLHLTGNVRQYVLSGIDGQEDIRNRDQEFSASRHITRAEAVSGLKEVLLEAKRVIDSLRIEDLSEPRDVQGFNESVMSIVIHVIEHMSYHVGQITYYTKYIKDIDTGYYAGLDLNAKS